MNGKQTYRNIIDDLIEMMVMGKLNPGDKLPGERTLAVELNASRASIREAFRTMEILGILEARHGGGTYVREFNISPFMNTLSPLLLKDMDMMGEIMDFRIMIESEAVKAAAKAKDPKAVEGMKRALSDMKSSNPETAERGDLEFHKLIFMAAGNRILSMAGESLSYILYKSIHESRERFEMDSRIKDIWNNDHKNILDAIMDGKPTDAEMALRKHLEGVREFMEEMLTEENKG